MLNKGIGIITIVDNDNYGNRLQNYATQTVLNNLKILNYTILNNSAFNNRWKCIYRKIKYFNKDMFNTYSSHEDRRHSFENFNKYINFTNKKYTILSKFDFEWLLVGSDQVWNPYFIRLSDLDLLNVNNVKKISFSASFGVEELPNTLNKNKLQRCFNNFNAISVREDSGKKILQSLGYKGNVSVLIDPTMLLTAKDWDKVSKRPNVLKGNKYILNYFLGTISDSRKREIEKVAEENDCEIINILDKNSKYYGCGPSEFLYLEKHAFLICTDSFHSSVFAIIYDRPFIVFDREQDNVVNMNSRLDTLITKFKLENRRYNEKQITKENINHDYSEAYKQLKLEKERAINFLKTTILGDLNEK